MQTSPPVALPARPGCLVCTLLSPIDPEALRVLVIGADPLARGGLCAAVLALDGFTLAGALPAFADDPTDYHLSFDASALLWDAAGGAMPAALPEPPVLALSPDLASARAALAGGARGVLLRDVDVERIAAALRALDCGMTVVDEAFAALVSAGGRVTQPEEPLTPRELDVLEGLSEGLSNRGIAGRLGVSEHTAKFHVNAIFAKLGARSRTDAVVRALRIGLLRL